MRKLLRRQSLVCSSGLPCTCFGLLLNRIRLFRHSAQPTGKLLGCLRLLSGLIIEHPTRLILCRNVLCRQTLLGWWTLLLNRCLIGQWQILCRQALLSRRSFVCRLDRLWRLRSWRGLIWRCAENCFLRAGSCLQPTRQTLRWLLRSRLLCSAYHPTGSRLLGHRLCGRGWRHRGGFLCRG